MSQPDPHTSQRFCDVLRTLMQTHHTMKNPNPRGRIRTGLPWTAAGLAKWLTIDPAEVGRWLRNERVPSQTGGYLSDLATLLELSEEEDNTLRQACEYSRPLIKRTRSTTANGDRASLQSLVRAAAPGQGPRFLTPIPEDILIPSLVPNGTPIADDEIIPTFVRLCHEAQSRPPGTIYLTYQGAERAMLSNSEQAAWFQQAVQGVLQKGWEVCQVIRLDRNTYRSIALVESMLAYLGLPGAYVPHYFTRYGVLPVPYDICVVPNIGGLILFATRQPARVDAGIYVSGKAATAVLTSHVQQLLSPHLELTKQLFTTYPETEDDHNERFQRLITATEEKGGDRFLCKQGLGQATRPEMAYQPGEAFYEAYSEYNRGNHIRHYYDRVAAWRLSVQTHTHRQICPMSAIIRLVDKGTYSADDFPANRRHLVEPVSYQLRHAHLSNTIQLLHDNDNFHLALLNAKEEQALYNSYWLAAGDHTVLLEVYRPTDRGVERQINMAVTESSIVRAFQDYADELWEKIAPDHRNKDWVIAELTKLVDRLEQEHPELRELR